VAISDVQGLPESSFLADKLEIKLERVGSKNSHV
jgi:hypothetical protein